MSISSSSSLKASLSPKGSVSPDGSVGNAAAQRFFSQGKRIPKDVKRHCGMCKQHGVLVETRGHTCEYKNCKCEQCELVRKRREIMSTQIRLRREQDKKFQRTTDASEADIVPWNGEIGEDKIPENVNMCYFCQKCKNHGILMWKKDHKKKCQFSDCKCEQCDLIDSRRALDRFIKKRKIGNNNKESSAAKSPRKEEPLPPISHSSSDESLSNSSDSSIVIPKIECEPHHDANNSLLSTASGSPATSPFDITGSIYSTPLDQLLQSTSPMMSMIPTSAASLQFLTVPQLMPTTVTHANNVTPFMPLFAPMTYANLLNPFLMGPTTIGGVMPLDMQILLANIQTLSEMTTAVSLANTD